MRVTAKDTARLQKLEEFNQLEWFLESYTLDEGRGFGELALQNEDPRTETVHCLTDCYFAKLSHADYQRVVRRVEKKQEEQKIEFFSRLPFC